MYCPIKILFLLCDFLHICLTEYIQVVKHHTKHDNINVVLKEVSSAPVYGWSVNGIIIIKKMDLYLIFHSQSVLNKLSFENWNVKERMWIPANIRKEKNQEEKSPWKLNDLRTVRGLGSLLYLTNHLFIWYAAFK